MGILFLSVAMALAVPVSQAGTEQAPAPPPPAPPPAVGLQGAEPPVDPPSADSDSQAEPPNPGDAQTAPEVATGEAEATAPEVTPESAKAAATVTGEPAADRSTPPKSETADAGIEAVPTGEEQSGEPGAAVWVDAEPTEMTPELLAELNAKVVADATLATDAPFLHTVALEAELDGNYPMALELLRAAAKLAPDDHLIVFDLARLALVAGIGDGGTDNDLEPFWRVEMGGEDAQVLRLAVAQQLHRDSATAKLLDVELPEWLAARASTGLAVDSNITITPDDAASHLKGARFAASGVLDFKTVRKPVDLDVTVMFDLGKYLDDSPRLANYDSATFILGSTLRYDVHPFLLTVSVNGTEIINDNFQSIFMQGIDSDVDLRYAWREWHIGAYVGGGGRDYRAGNPEQKAFKMDRDGGHLRAGLGWDWQDQFFGGPLGIRGRLGWAHEATQGEKLRVHSSEFLLVGHYVRDRFEAMAGLSNKLRVYPGDSSGPSGDGDDRIDNRLTPFARVGFSISEQIVVYGSYAFTNNYSTIADDDRDFNYNRHMGELGVEFRL